MRVVYVLFLNFSVNLKLFQLKLNYKDEINILGGKRVQRKDQLYDELNYLEIW